MYTPDTGLDIITRRTFAAGLSRREDDQREGWKATCSKIALWYYQSSLQLVPDLIPGFGYLDNYLLAQIVLWLCNPDPDSISADRLSDFDFRCREFLESKEKIPLSKIEG